MTGGAISNRFSAKDLPSELTLKVRKPEQRAESLSRAEMKAALVAKERASKGKDASALSEGTEAVGVPLALTDGTTGIDVSKFDDSDDSVSSMSGSDESVSDDDEEEAELMRELEKIKAEREAARLAKEAEEAAAAAKEREAVLLTGNPLLGTGLVKRKWYDDVVFRNQARDEPKTKKRFINDTVRNDFHKRFMSKYIK